MSNKLKGSNMGVTSDDSIMELLTKITDGSVGTSESQLLAMLNGMPFNENTSKVLCLCLLASMNVKRTVDLVKIAAGVNVPVEMKIEDSVNMSVMAQIGHMMMMMDDSDYTNFGLDRKRKYMESIGGAKNIASFTNFRDASSTRHTILKKYSASLAGYDVNAFKKVIKPRVGIMYNATLFATTFGKAGRTSRSVWKTSKKVTNGMVIKPAKNVAFATMLVIGLISLLDYTSVGKPYAVPLIDFMVPANNGTKSGGLRANTALIVPSVASTSLSVYPALFGTASSIASNPDKALEILTERSEMVMADVEMRVKVAGKSLDMEEGMDFDEMEEKAYELFDSAVDKATDAGERLVEMASKGYDKIMAYLDGDSEVDESKNDASDMEEEAVNISVTADEPNEAELTEDELMDPAFAVLPQFESEDNSTSPASEGESDLYKDEDVMSQDSDVVP